MKTLNLFCQAKQNDFEEVKSIFLKNFLVKCNTSIVPMPNPFSFKGKHHDEKHIAGPTDHEGAFKLDKTRHLNRILYLSFENGGKEEITPAIVWLARTICPPVRHGSHWDI